MVLTHECVFKHKRWVRSNSSTAKEFDRATFISPRLNVSNEPGERKDGYFHLIVIMQHSLMLKPYIANIVIM